MAKKRKPKKNFYRNASSRNYDDVAYSEFRKAVRKRDGHKCMYPGCDSTKSLHVHHIRKWASYPSLRYDVTNGITLCKKCHREKTTSEVKLKTRSKNAKKKKKSRN